MKKILLVFSSLLLLIGLLGCEKLNNNRKNGNEEKESDKEYGGTSMFTVKGYINQVEDNLEKNSEELIGNIKALHKLNFFSEIELLDFSSFNDSTSFEISIMMFSMDSDANEVFYEGNDKNIFAGSLQVLDDTEYYQLPDNQSDAFWEFYEKNEEEINKAEQKIFTNWFIDCWNKANGQELNLPTYFNFHDDTKSFDLKKNRWIDDEDKWSN